MNNYTLKFPIKLPTNDLPIEEHGHGHSEWVLGTALLIFDVVAVDALADGGQIIEL